MIFNNVAFKCCKYKDRGQAQENWRSVAWFTTVTEGWEMPYFRESRQRAMHHLQRSHKACEGKSLL